MAVAPPAITTLVGQPTNGSAIEVKGTGEAGDTVTLYADGGATAVGAGVVALNGSFDISTNVAFTDQLHTVTATQTTPSGFTGIASTGFTVAVDPTAPAITTLVGQPTNGSTIEVQGTGEAGESITLYADGGATAVGSGTVAGNGSFDIATSATFADGVHSLDAVQTDAANLSSTASAAFGVNVDPTMPAITTLVGQPTNGSTIEVRGTGEAGESITLYANGGATAVGSGTVAGNGNFDITTSATFADGTYALTAVQSDTAGLSSTASPAFAVHVNPTAPSISGISPDTGLSASDGITNVATVTVSGAAEANISVTLYDGLTPVGTVAADGGGNWSVAGVTLSEGTNNLTATATDTAGNTGTASAVFVATLDQDLGETATVSFADANIGAAKVAAEHFSVGGLDTDDNGTVTFSDGTHTQTVNIVNGAAASSTVNLSGFTDGPITATLAASDAAGNTFGASANATLDQDAGETATVSFADANIGLAKAGAEHFTVGGLDTDDNGTVTFSDGNVAHNQVVAITNGAAASSTVNLSGMTDGPITATLTASDAAGNTFGASANATLDQTTPTVTVTTNSTDVNLAHGTATVTFSFSEAPTTFGLADTSAVGGALGNLQQVSATQYTATFTGAPNTDISNASVSVTAGSWQESNGNPGGGGSTSFTVDTVTPTVVVTTNNTDVNLAHGTATVTFAFSEAPAIFSLADTSAVGGSLSNLQQVSATQYTATFTGATNTDISNASVSVSAGSWQESNGNPGGGGSTSFTVDTVTPTVVVTTNNTDVNLAHGTATVTFSFSEAPTTFGLGDTSAVGGILGNLQQVSATQYTATFTGATNTDISNASVSVSAGSWQESNGNPGSGGSTAFTVDTVTPTVVVTTNNTDVNLAHGTATVTFAFSEAPTIFSLADTSAVGGSLSSLQQVSATQYTATFTGAANTDISNASVSVTGGSWQESNGNPGGGGSTSFTVDTVTPTVTVTTNNTDVTLAHDTATVTFSFSEAPTLFSLADTSAVGGSLTNLQQVSATQYTATFTSAANTDTNNASVSVTGGSWQESNGNPGSGGSTTFTVDTEATTPTVVVTTSNTDVNLAHGTATVTFTFSAAPTTFTLADTSAVGGALTNLQKVTATQYTATFTGAANTDTRSASVSVIAGSWNAGGNAGTGGSVTFTVDTVTPTVPNVDLDAAAGATLSATAAHGVLAGASDPTASEPLTVSAVNGAAANVGRAIATAYGTLTLNADGSYSYTATASAASLPNGAAEDNVTFTVTDLNGNSTTSTLSILVYGSSLTLYVGAAGGSLNVGNGNSVIDGRAGTETITAGNGKDDIFAGDNATITAGNGQDAVTAGANSRITLGNGNDTVTAGAGSTISLGNGSNTVTGGANDTITAGNGQDAVTAGANSRITLGNGNDTVTAGSGSTISLGNGNNTVTGGSNDTTVVGNGQDQLVAAPGDVWTIGGGQDVFTFNAGFGNNTVNGFSTSHDVLQFNHALFANYMAAMTDTKQVGANTVITYDANDSVTLNGVTASHLTANNFKFS